MRILLFDIDGTLLISNGGGRRAFERALEVEFGLSQPQVDIPFSGRTDHGLMSELLQLNGLPADALHRGRLRRRYAQFLPAELQRSGGQVLPGVSELLGRLASDRRVQVAAMTGNLPETATRKLEHFQLMHWIRFIIAGDLDAERIAMARRGAAQILSRHGAVAARNMIVIGDTPDDIRCSHAIGATAIAVCTGHYSRTALEAERPQVTLDDLSDVDNVFTLLVETSLAAAEE